MKIGIDDVRGFLAVYETSGFKGAADRLSITSSALTQRIQKLEGYLGARLFDRSTRNVEPTELGKLFLPEAQRILQEFESSIARIQDVVAQRKGLVSFACLLTVASGLAPDILARFRARSRASASACWTTRRFGFPTICGRGGRNSASTCG